jgi:hypothetical protein
MAQDKESFISSEERPGVSLKPDTPISELRVRDLQTLLQGVTFSKIGVNDTKIWPETKDRFGKPEKNETKNETKPEGKNEAKDLKNEKNEKPEKYEKYEKDEKYEGKYEGKNEKYEGKPETKDSTKYEYEVRYFNLKQPDKENVGTSSGGETVSPAAIDQLIRTISGLSEQVTTLTQEVQKLKQQPDKS